MPMQYSMLPREGQSFASVDVTVLTLAWTAKIAIDAARKKETLASASRNTRPVRVSWRLERSPLPNPWVVRSHVDSRKHAAAKVRRQIRRPQLRLVTETP
jgi:hypothetical protein